MTDARRRIPEIGAESFVIHRMNGYIDTQTVLQLFDCVSQGVVGAGQAGERSGISEPPITRECKPPY